MKQTAQNQFNDGLNLDLHPIVTPNSVLTDNINGTFITYNGNEFCLQNDRGNIIKAKLTDGFTPIGIKEHNGVLYIVSAKYKETTIDDETTTEIEGEIGTYPGIDWTNWELHKEQDKSFNYDAYTPLCNCKLDGVDSSMTTSKFNFDFEHPVSIEIQDSYDGSVNLILTDNKNEPRLINSGFSVLPDGKYKFPKRNDNNDNIYTLDDTFNSQTRLIKNSIAFTSFEFVEVLCGRGELKGGNYTFYLRYGDDDENVSDIVCQSGIVCITKGQGDGDSDLRNVRGTLMDELTDKEIHFRIHGLDPNYSRFYLYYTREYSDTNGYLMTESKAITTPYEYKKDDTEPYKWLDITITGTEVIDSISEEVLNIQYHSVTACKTSTQHSDFLFLGNVEAKSKFDDRLEDISLEIPISIEIGSAIDLPKYHGKYDKGYADPYEVYNSLGYWPDEYYRLGVIYIYDDGTVSNVYNLKGCTSLDRYTSNIDFPDDSPALNKYGVFKFSSDYQFGDTINPIFFKATMTPTIAKKLSNLNIIGYAIVRQKRHPITLCQGVSIPIDTKYGLPLIPRRKRNTDNEMAIDVVTDPNQLYGLTESFISQDFEKSPSYRIGWGYRLGWHLPWTEGSEPNNIEEDDFIKRCNLQESSLSYNSVVDLHSFVMPSDGFKINGLISADALLVKDVQNSLNDTRILNPLFKLSQGFKNHGIREGKNTYIYDIDATELDVPIKPEVNTVECKVTYIPENTVSKVIDDLPHATIIGNEASVSDFGVMESESVIKSQIDSDEDIRNYSLVRGHFIPYIYASKDLGSESGIYNISLPYRQTSTEIQTLKNDNSPFYMVTDRIPIDPNDAAQDINITRGDCYICRVWLRYNRNFIGSTKPVNFILKNKWDDLLGFNRGTTGKKFDQASWENVNLADVNNVPLGLWISYVCYSNYNLQVRCNDSSDTYMTSFMGMERSFFPCQDISVLNQYKQDDSHLLNAGYSTTVGRIRYPAPSSIPYIKTEYSNRILFSNKHVTDAFINGYRNFQGLSYHDYDKQYGEIIKLLPWKDSLFCVMEHGLSLVPINERALLQTTTDQTIHIYGHGVLPENMTLISPDYGSKYEESVVKTPIGIYGIDTSTRKIWRFSEQNGFETLSDMKIESYLNDTLNSEYIINVGKCDVRTHYNSFKGDLIFTWYDSENNELFSICYNERQNIWVTKYDWLPIVSENSNGTFFSLQKGTDSEGAFGVYSHEVKEASPTKWYGKQHPFEFEFVVSDPIGIHKIYENLQIISNNVQPEELQFEFIGDAYMFNKARIYHTVFEKPNWASNRVYKNETVETYYVDNPTKDSSMYSKPHIEASQKLGYKPFRNCSKLNDRDQIVYGEVIKTVNATEQYHLRIPQECRNMETWGRRLGNIHYKNDSWFTTIEPIIYDAKLNNPYINNLDNDEVKWQSARIRDKWCKIRVRYSGEDLAVITAIKTIINI